MESGPDYGSDLVTYCECLTPVEIDVILHL